MLVRGSSASVPGTRGSGSFHESRRAARVMHVSLSGTVPPSLGSRGFKSTTCEGMSKYLVPLYGAECRPDQSSNSRTVKDLHSVLRRALSHNEMPSRKPTATPGYDLSLSRATITSFR